MEEINKQRRILHAASELFAAQGIETTSVNDIVKEANVAKGTFYVYYKDKQELISQILREKHGRMLHEILECSYARALETHQSWKQLFIEDLIGFYKQHPQILAMIHTHAGLLFDTAKQRMEIFRHVARMEAFIACFVQDEEDMERGMNRLLLILEIINTVCYNAIFHTHPAPIEQVLPMLQSILTNI